MELMITSEEPLNQEQLENCNLLESQGRTAEGVFIYKAWVQVEDVLLFAADSRITSVWHKRLNFIKNKGKVKTADDMRKVYRTQVFN